MCFSSFISYIDSLFTNKSSEMTKITIEFLTFDKRFEFRYKNQSEALLTSKQANKSYAMKKKTLFAVILGGKLQNNLKTGSIF